MNGNLIYYLFLSFYVFFFAILVIIGIFFIYRAYRTKLSNLYYLGFGFIFIIIGVATSIIFHLFTIIQHIFVVISYICLILFTNKTFHRNKGKYVEKIVLIVLCLAILDTIFSFLDMNKSTPVFYYLKLIFDIPFNFITFNWISCSSFFAYKRIKDKNIQPWVMFRYKLIAIFSFILSLNIIPQIFQPWNIEWGDPNNLASLIVFGIMATNAIIFSIGFLLAWMMPKKVKIFINRNYQSIEDKEITEEELMVLIQKELLEKNK